MISRRIIAIGLVFALTSQGPLQAMKPYSFPSSFLSFNLGLQAPFNAEAFAPPATSSPWWRIDVHILALVNRGLRPNIPLAENATDAPSEIIQRRLSRINANASFPVNNDEPLFADFHTWLAARHSIEWPGGARYRTVTAQARFWSKSHSWHKFQVVLDSKWAKAFPELALLAEERGYLYPDPRALVQLWLRAMSTKSGQILILIDEIQAPRGFGKLTTSQRHHLAEGKRIAADLVAEWAQTKGYTTIALHEKFAHTRWPMIGQQIIDRDYRGTFQNRDSWVPVHYSIIGGSVKPGEEWWYVYNPAPKTIPPLLDLESHPQEFARSFYAADRRNTTLLDEPYQGDTDIALGLPAEDILHMPQVIPAISHPMSYKFNLNGVSSYVVGEGDRLRVRLADQESKVLLASRNYASCTAVVIKALDSQGGTMLSLAHVTADDPVGAFAQIQAELADLKSSGHTEIKIFVSLDPWSLQPADPTKPNDKFLGFPSDLQSAVGNDATILAVHQARHYAAFNPILRDLDIKVPLDSKARRNVYVTPEGILIEHWHDFPLEHSNVRFERMAWDGTWSAYNPSGTSISQLAKVATGRWWTRIPSVRLFARDTTTLQSVRRAS